MALVDLTWVSFRRFDRKGEGVITRKSMRHAVKHGLEMTPAEIKRMVKLADDSGDGELDFGEYFRFMTELELPAVYTKERLRAFSALDRNGDGTVTKKELSHARRHGSLDMSKPEIDLLLQHGEDGELTLSQFVEAASGTALESFVRLDDDYLFEFFKSLDAKQNGYITKRELRHAADRLGFRSNQVDEIMDAADKNGDGKITYVEFKALMTPK